MHANKPLKDILQLGRNNPKQQNRLGADLLESSSAGKDLGVLVDDKVTMRQQCALLARRTSSVLGCIRNIMDSWSGQLILAFCSALVRPYLCPDLGLSLEKRRPKGNFMLSTST